MRKILIASVFALSGLVLVSCNDGNASSKVKKENVENAKKRDSEISKGAALIEFDKTVHDFGTVNEGEVVEATFIVKNTGKSDLIITHVRPSCGCTVPVWSKDPIKPGDSSKIVAKFNTAGKPNRQSKTITLTTNTLKGSEVLRIKGNVTPKAKA